MTDREHEEKNDAPPQVDPSEDEDATGGDATGDEVEEGSKESFPASDPPAW